MRHCFLCNNLVSILRLIFLTFSLVFQLLSSTHRIRTFFRNVLCFKATKLYLMRRLPLCCLGGYDGEGIEDNLNLVGCYINYLLVTLTDLISSCSAGDSGALGSSAIPEAPASTLGPGCEVLPLFWPFLYSPTTFWRHSYTTVVHSRKLAERMRTQSAWT